MKEIDFSALFCSVSEAYKAVNKANKEEPGIAHCAVLRLSDYEKKEGKRNAGI